ncbi:MAG: hypothetical protein ACR2PW_07375 [Gammaproteobacteria bacterium]
MTPISPLTVSDQELIDEYLDAQTHRASSSDQIPYLGFSSEANQTAFNQKRAENPQFAQAVEEQIGLQKQLAQLPKPALSSEAITRALMIAKQADRLASAHRRNGFKKGFAVAASVAALAVSALLLSFAYPAQTGLSVAEELSSASPIQLAGLGWAQPETIDVYIRSDESVAGAVIRITLPESVELADYPDYTVLEWQTDLSPGINQISLPVLSFGGNQSQQVQLVAEIFTDTWHMEQTVEVTIDGS